MIHIYLVLRVDPKSTFWKMRWTEELRSRDWTITQHPLLQPSQGSIGLYYAIVRAFNLTAKCRILQFESIYLLAHFKNLCCFIWTCVFIARGDLFAIVKRDAPWTLRSFLGHPPTSPSRPGKSGGVYQIIVSLIHQLGKTGQIIPNLIKFVSNEISLVNHHLEWGWLLYFHKQNGQFANKFQVTRNLSKQSGSRDSAHHTVCRDLGGICFM